MMANRKCRTFPLDSDDGLVVAATSRSVGLVRGFREIFPGTFAADHDNNAFDCGDRQRSGKFVRMLSERVADVLGRFMHTTFTTCRVVLG